MIKIDSVLAQILQDFDGIGGYRYAFYISVSFSFLSRRYLEA